MSCQLPADCLNEIFKYLEQDKVSLHSCLLINRLCPIKIECPENVRKMFRIIIYKFRTLFIVRKMFQNVIVSDIRNLSKICPECVRNLSRICPSPEFVLKTDL